MQNKTMAKVKTIKSKKSIPTYMESACVNVTWLKGRILSEIQYASKPHVQNCSEARLNGYTDGLKWVCEYLDLLLEIEKEATK